MNLSRNVVVMVVYLVVGALLIEIDVDDIDPCLPKLAPCTPRIVFFQLKDLIVPDNEGKVVNENLPIALHRCSSYFSCCAEDNQVCVMKKQENLCISLEYHPYNGNYTRKRGIIVQNHTKCLCVNGTNWTNPLDIKPQNLLERCN